MRLTDIKNDGNFTYIKSGTMDCNFSTYWNAIVHSCTIED